MAQAKFDESAAIEPTNSANARATLSGTSPSGKSAQMVQGSKPAQREPQMGAGTSLFTDWASI